MAMRPGEEIVATLFGDIHYFYGPETDNPPHHRFSKGSYVYLFENAQEARARIEIANRVRNKHQDAFNGFLDHTAVTYSYKHSCMVSLMVLAKISNQEEWHLPTYDPFNQNIYHYPLHAVDIYFWTYSDALKFVNGVRRVMPANQLDICDEPVVPAPPPLHLQQIYHPVPVCDSASNPATWTRDAFDGTGDLAGGVPHVVQRLDTLSISGQPDGSTKPLRRSGPTSAVEVSFKGPPTATSNSKEREPQQLPVSQAPFSYNPAAPAAPETIRLRTKTPPPEESSGRHPLHQTLYDDAATPFSPGLVVPVGLGPLSPGVLPPVTQFPPGAPTFPAPPVYGNVPLPPAVAQHPVQAGPSQQHAIQQSRFTSSLAMPITSPSPFNPAASFPVFSPPPMSAAAPPTPAATNGNATPLLFKPPLEAGYSNYNYGGQVVGSGQTPDYSIHQQLYRPTHGELVSHAPKKEPRGRLEESAGRLEKGVTGMLKKFEKRFG
ncbi:MAG: hypothetical protein SEPTF4163_001131 [Sporothrix epigloea]